MTPNEPAVVNVVVIFGPASASSERLASSAAVGAVQARARIRLRRLDVFTDATTEEEAQRLRETYVLPTSRDIDWADAIVLVTDEQGGVNWRGLPGLNADCTLRAGAVLSPDEKCGAEPTAALLERATAVMGTSYEFDSRAPEARAHHAMLVGRQLVLVSRLLQSGASTLEDARRLLPEGHGLG